MVQVVGTFSCFKPQPITSLKVWETFSTVNFGILIGAMAESLHSKGTKGPVVGFSLTSAIGRCIKGKMRQHKFDTDGSCRENGLSAEQQFSKIATEAGFRCEKASFGFDVRHVDFFLYKDDELCKKVDVKARKRLSRQDSDVQDKLCFVEVRSASPTWPSWLDGDADFIAFERENDFLLTPRLQLKELVAELCDLTAFTKKSGDCLYKAYRRWNKPHELVTLVKFEDILVGTDVEIWKK